jgi:hypothetical protein
MRGATGMPEIIETRPSRYRQTIAFVYIRDNDGQQVENGTGFFIGVEGNVEGAIFTYFVTARHVLYGDDGELTDNFSIRVNSGGSTRYLSWTPNEITGEVSKYTHPDDSVDLVVIPFGYGLSKLDVLLFTTDMFVKKEWVLNGDIEEGEERLIPR